MMLTKNLGSSFESTASNVFGSLPSKFDKIISIDLE